MGGLPKDAKLLIATMSMLSFVGGYMQVVELIYLSLIGFDAASIGLLVSVSAIAPLRMVVYSIIADKYGKTRVLAFIYLMVALYFVIYYFTTDFMWFLFAALFLGGSFGGVMYGGVVEQALLTEKSGDEMRTIAFSTRSSITSIFSILGNSLSGLPEHLQTAYSLDVIGSIKPLFILGALLSLVAAATILLIKDDQAQRKISVTRKNILPRKSGGLILRFSLSSLLMGIGNGVFYRLVSLWFWLTYGPTYEITLSEVGYILAVSKIIEAPTFLLAPLLASKFGLVKAYLVIRLAGMVAFSFMPFMPNPVLAALMFSARSALMHLGLPLKTSYTMAVLSPEERASAASLINLPGIIPRALAIALGGYLMEYVSTALPVYIAVAAFSSEAIYYYLIFRNVKPPEERTNVAGDASP